jgi:hypothetical protein
MLSVRLNVCEYVSISDCKIAFNITASIQFWLQELNLFKFLIKLYICLTCYY